MVKDRLTLSLGNISGTFKGTDSPDYICLEVVLLDRAWLGDETPDFVFIEQKNSRMFNGHLKLFSNPNACQSSFFPFEDG